MKNWVDRLFTVIFPLALSLLVAGQARPVAVAEPSMATAQAPVAVAEPSKAKAQSPAPVPVAEAEPSKAKAQRPVAEATKEKKNIEKNIKDLEDQWNDAVLKHDVATMSRILAKDVIDTSGTGHVQGKAEDLADLKSGEPKLESSSVDDMKVRVYGTVAVVIGHYTQKGSYKGKDITGEGRFTDMFVERQGRWECVSTQATPIAKQ
jgi:ketosteroid isomerase-like protein